MITGHVDDCGRALVPVVIGDPLSPLGQIVQAWIDTAFTGTMLLPSHLVSALNLPRAADVNGVLADGSPTLLHTHLCRIELFGKSSVFDVAVSPGKFPLLGIQLLEDLVLNINYPARTVTLTPSSAA